MGSGNKDKRKRRQLGERVEPEENSGKNPLWNKKAGAPLAPKPGVVFDLEPDADRIFQDSLSQWDDRLAEIEGEDGEEGGARSAAPKADRSAPVEIDLHRLTLEEAIWRVDAELDQALASRQQRTFKIITGKGLHSGPAGGVLAREMHRHIAERYARHIKDMDESPADVKIGGVPLRGHFSVTLKKKA